MCLTEVIYSVTGRCPWAALAAWSDRSAAWLNVTGWSSVQRDADVLPTTSYLAPQDQLHYWHLTSHRPLNDTSNVSIYRVRPIKVQTLNPFVVINHTGRFDSCKTSLLLKYKIQYRTKTAGLIKMRCVMIVACAVRLCDRYKLLLHNCFNYFRSASETLGNGLLK